MVYPARVVGTVIAHLAVVDELHGLVAVCAQLKPIPLELVPDDEGDELVWCSPCGEYRRYIEAGGVDRAGQLREALKRPAVGYRETVAFEHQVQLPES